MSLAFFTSFMRVSKASTSATVFANRASRRSISRFVNHVMVGVSMAMYIGPPAGNWPIRRGSTPWSAATTPPIAKSASMSMECPSIVNAAVIRVMSDSEVTIAWMSEETSERSPCCAFKTAALSAFDMSLVRSASVCWSIIGAIEAIGATPRAIEPKSEPSIATATCPFGSSFSRGFPVFLGEV